MKFFQGLGLTMVLIWLAAVIGGLTGWVMNIVAVVHSVSGPLTEMLVLRIIGIPVFILGAILGWVS